MKKSFTFKDLAKRSLLAQCQPSMLGNKNEAGAAASGSKFRSPMVSMLMMKRPMAATECAVTAFTADAVMAGAFNIAASIKLKPSQPKATAAEGLPAVQETIIENSLHHKPEPEPEHKAVEARQTDN